MRCLTKKCSLLLALSTLRVCRRGFESLCIIVFYVLTFNFLEVGGKFSNVSYNNDARTDGKCAASNFVEPTLHNFETL